MPQLKYFQSEVFELNEVIIRQEEAERNWFEGYDFEEKEEFKQHITEEIADVLVMLEQFRNYYDIDINDIKEVMEQKIDRQLKRIEEEDK